MNKWVKKWFCIAISTILVSTSSISAFAVAPGQSGSAGVLLQQTNRVYVDDLGRQVTLPAAIDCFAPSGSMAQMALYSVDPSKVAGWASALSVEQKNYIPSQYWNLPVLGQVYGGSTPFNEPAVIASGADVIIDIGQIKGSASDMAAALNTIQNDTDIPVVFIQGDDLPNYPGVYEKLGEVLGDDTQTEPLESYCQDFIDYVALIKPTITSAVSSSRKVYDGEGDTGLLTNGTMGGGAIHQNAIGFIGGTNVATITSAGSGRTPVTMQQVQTWAPQAIIFGPDSIYNTVASNPSWASIPAIQNHRYAQIPSGFYNWMDRPPSINRVLGAQWLAHLLFPDYYTDYADIDDIKDLAVEFYDLFYHYNLTEQDVDDLLEKGDFGTPW